MACDYICIDVEWVMVLYWHTRTARIKILQFCNKISLPANSQLSVRNFVSEAREQSQRWADCESNVVRRGRIRID